MLENALKMRSIRMSPLLLCHVIETVTWIHNFGIGSSWISILRELMFHSGGFLQTVKLLGKFVLSAKLVV